MKCGCSIVFPSILKIWYVKVRMSRSISESPLVFEITRIDCMWYYWGHVYNLGLPVRKFISTRNSHSLTSTANTCLRSKRMLINIINKRSKRQVNFVSLYSKKKNVTITKTCVYNFDPLKTHCGLQGYTLFSLFLLKNIDCWYLLEPPRRGGSNEYPQSMFWAEMWKISELFIWKFSVFRSEIFYIFE